MTEDRSPPIPESHQPATFRTTRWSLVFAAQGKLSQADAAQSLETLCRQYWPPLYAYVRHRGHSVHDAQDLTQAFFTRLLEKDWLMAVDRERGRFRTFLLMALKRFLANEWDRTQSQKRGGGVKFINMEAAESISIPDPRTTTAELLFERRWAFTLLETVMERLRDEHVAAGRAAQYEQLKSTLTAARGGIDYDQLGVTLGMQPASARSAVHRLRKRFRELFRDEVSSTVADPAEVDDEMRAVIAALGSD
ncbi:MAG: sigma-70 family RNA polymerase sigma factor [Pirellulales bacterium]